MTIFKGVATALITPMTENRVDYEGLEKLIKIQLNSGINALVANGTTGEPSTLTDAEKRKVSEIVLEITNKKVPVIVGAGSNSTACAIQLAKDASEMGADALLCVTPYYNKCTQQGMVEHFKAIADNTILPIIMYNVPSRTSVNLLPETITKLAGYKGICAVKEASGNISQIMDIARINPKILSIYSGDDGLTYPVLTLGGLGVISVVSNIIPQYMCELTKAYFDGDKQRALTLQLNILPLIKAVFCEVNPIPIKCAAKLLGLIGDDYVRLPLTKCSNKKLVLSELINLGLLSNDNNLED